jgi:type I site-specific restriction endonuclease
MVLHRHHHRAHHSVGYIGRSGDEQKIASRHPRSRHGVLASETTVAESPSFYTDCGNIKRFPRRSNAASSSLTAETSATSRERPNAAASNGDGFVFHDRTGSGGATESHLSLDAFPPPAELRGRYRAWKGLTDELQDYFEDGSGKGPRYYQVNAVNAAIEAIAKGSDRILLVMATGTGETYTAFQILWRLWKAGRKKRILYLADRNVLIDQTMVNDFRPFGCFASVALVGAPARCIDFV